MKRRISMLILFTLTVSIAVFSAGNISLNKDPCNKEKYHTAEPGTCLDPRAYRFLKAIDKFEENPYKHEFTKKILDFFEPKVYQTIDTIVSYPEYNVPIRIYYPEKESAINKVPVIYFIHGGGFVFGSIENYDMAVKKLALVTGKIIISVDYRLAPDYPFPAALHDVDAVLDWIIDNMDFIGGSGNKVFVMGDSAGGNLATVLAIKNRDEGKDHIISQILYYPPTTFEEIEFPSRRYFLLDESREYLPTEAFVRRSKESYLPEDIELKNPYISPLAADLTYGIPPALIINAQVDPLRDDGIKYAEKLKNSGQEVTHIQYDGLIHGFLNFYMVFKESEDSMEKVRDFVNEQIENNAMIQVAS